MSDEKEVNALHTEATELGISFHPAIGDVKLQKKINEHKAANPIAPTDSTKDGEDTVDVDADKASDPAVTAVTEDIVDDQEKVLADTQVEPVSDPIGVEAEIAARVKAILAEKEVKAKKVEVERADTTEVKPEPKLAPVKTDMQKKAERYKTIRQNANKLIRVNITCMNPNKRTQPGELFCVGNKVIGTVKKFVPFNTTEGFHVPNVLLNMIKDRKCQIFVEVVLPGPGNKKTKKGKLIQEFSIQYLDALKPQELKDLAERQALSGSIDSEV